MNDAVPTILTRRQVLIAAGAGAAGMLVGCAKTATRTPLVFGHADPLPIDPTIPDVSPDRSGLPTVMPRSAWTHAEPRLWLANPMNGISQITVHHDGMPPVHLTTRAQVAERIDVIRRGHLRRGWADIGYHYIVDPQGYVWQGRPRTLQGAHVKDHNEHNLGVLVLGNFMIEYPTAEAVRSLDHFVVGNMRLFRVPLRSLHTHRELNPTKCPGTHLQAHMDTARARRGAIAQVL